MSLEPIRFNNKLDSEDINNKLQTIDEIKAIFLKTCNTSVGIKKYQPPLLIVSVNNSPAGSEIKLKNNQLISKLTGYKIKSIKIVINS